MGIVRQYIDCLCRVNTPSGAPKCLNRQGFQGFGRVWSALDMPGLHSYQLVRQKYFLRKFQPARTRIHKGKENRESQTDSGRVQGSL